MQKPTADTAVLLPGAQPECTPPRSLLHQGSHHKLAQKTKPRTPLDMVVHMRLQAQSPSHQQKTKKTKISTKSLAKTYDSFFSLSQMHANSITWDKSKTLHYLKLCKDCELCLHPPLLQLIGAKQLF